MSYVFYQLVNVRGTTTFTYYYVVTGKYSAHSLLFRIGEHLARGESFYLFSELLIAIPSNVLLL